MINSLSPQSCRVALLSGGKSKERDISLASGIEARKALEKAGFLVTSFDPANKEDLKKLIEGGFDVAFVCLHGRYGEDGTIQGFLELIELPYTGSGVWSSSLAIDKTKSKVFYANAGIATPKSITIQSLNDVSIAQIIEQVGEHCVVKAPKEGSSFGIHIVQGASQLEKALASILESDGEALIEAFVEGTELTVSVVGNSEPEALPVIEIVPTNSFYDFESKYAPGGSKHVCPAPLTDEQTKRVQELAVKAHKTLCCKGFSRSDFILDKQGEFWLLETNTLPGMTETSLLPDAAKVAGIEFPDLCKKFVEMAMEGK